MKSWTTSGRQTVYRLLYGRSNCYLVENNGHLMLVDCGSSLQRYGLLTRLEQFGAGQKPVSLVLTHSHFDHAANTACLVEKYHLPVLIQRSEAVFLRRGENPGVRGTVLLTKLLTCLLPFEMLMRLVNYSPVEADILVGEDYDLNDIGIDGRLLLTPGHTPGSMSVILEDEIAIVGDTMSNFLTDSVLPTYALDVKLLVSSWQKLLESGCTLFLPGHGGECSRDLVQQQYAYYRKKFAV